MNRNYIYIVLILTFLSSLLIVFYFVDGRKEPTLTTKEIQAESPPFLAYISGTGVVESASGNILISSPLIRTVEKINVAVNKPVNKGEVLFQLYNKDLKANLRIKQTRYQETLSNLNKLQKIPQSEDLNIAQANLNKAEAALNQAYTEYNKNACRAKGSDRCILYYKYQQSEADFQIAQAQFEKVQSGTWQPELQIAQDRINQAKAEIDAIQSEIEQTSIKSPISGTVLQVKIHEGEVVDPSRTAITLGNIDELNLRVSIDQFNEARFGPNCPAVAFKQGNTTKEFELEFIHVEPFMVPKKYLTNSLHEKVDTQIFEILYRIKKNDSHLFIGEQMNVYIHEEKKTGS